MTGIRRVSRLVPVGPGEFVDPLLHRLIDQEGRASMMRLERGLKLTNTWRKAMQPALFTPCSVEHGDKKVRGQMIICGKCGNIGRVPVAQMGFSTGNDDREVQLQTMRKFSNIGWQIGKQTSRHRCPTCIAATKPFAEALTPLKNNKEEPMPNNGTTHHPAEELAETAAPAPAMSRDDRRVIFTKLNDVYVNSVSGYERDWTDKRVAEDLGVPRAWVAQVREENFGPDHNSEFEQQIAFAKGVIEDVKAINRELAALKLRHQGELEAMTHRIKPLAVVMEKTERAIAAIEKATVT